MTQTLNDPRMFDTSQALGAHDASNLTNVPGMWTPLSTTTLSATSTWEYTSLSADTTYLIKIERYIPTTSNTSIWMRYGYGGTPTYETTSNYHQTQMGKETTTSRDTYSTLTAANTPFGTSGAQSNTHTANCDITLWTGAGTGGTGNSDYPIFYAHGQYHAHGVARATTFTSVGGSYTGTWSSNAVTAVQLQSSSGTMAEGVITIYQLVTS